MWLFLSTEILFFGGLFAAYTVYRFSYPRAFAAASHELLMWAGALDTAILLCSSFAMALAVHAAQSGIAQTDPGVSAVVGGDHRVGISDVARV